MGRTGFLHRRLLGRARTRTLAGVCVSALLAAGLTTVSAAPAMAADYTVLQVGPRPNATRVDFRPANGISASVDVGTGNLLVTTTDLTLPGIDHDVPLGLDFNSLLLGPGSPLPVGAAGPGWALRLGQDTKIRLNSDNSMMVWGPDGIEGRFTPSGTNNYTSPAGYKASLVKTSSGWSLTDHATGAKSAFNWTGTLTSITDRNNNITGFSYNGTQSATITSTRGGTHAHTALFTYTGNVLTQITQASDTTGSRSVHYGYDANGRLASLTDAAGNVTTFGYDTTTGDLTSIDDPSTTVTTFTYDTSHRVSAVSFGTATNPAITRLAYPSGTQTLLAGPNTDQAQAVTAVPHVTYTLDATGRVTQAVDELGHARSRSYTPFTDVNTATNGVGGLATTTHVSNSGESLNSITSPTGTTTSLTYSSTGVANPFLPTGSTDPQGNSAVLTYDAVGNPATTTNSATAAKAQVSYRLPPGDGTLATSTDPAGNVTSYGEDAATHEITSITPPAGVGLGTTTLTWDGYGRVGSVTDGRGVTATYAWTDIDQLKSITYSDSTPTISYTYNSSGLVKTRTDGTGTVTFGYSGRDELTSRTASTGGGDLSYGYDLAGNLTDSTNALGITAYTYDAANQLTSMTDAAKNLTLFGYDNDGRRTDTWWDTVTGHATFAAHTHTDFDAAGRIARTWTSRASSDTTKAFDTSYCYVTTSPCPTSTNTSTGNRALIQWSTDNLSGATSTYTYDGANRLKSVTNYGGHTYGYAYDANGNRTSVTTDGATTQTLTFDAGNQVTTSGYSFNKNGQQTHAPKGLGSMDYNAAGQMTAQTSSSSTSATYTYAGQGQDELLTQKITGGSTYGYIYGRPDSHGEPTMDSMTKDGAASYLDNDPTGAPLALHPNTGNTVYYVTDGQGSIVALIDTTGTVAGTYTYDPYGTQTGTTGTAAAVDLNPFRYTTGLLDRSTGWLKHGARWNDTSSGRWTTTDPVTFLNDPNQANPYGYAADNPINHTDPTGRTGTNNIGSAFATIAAAGALEGSLFIFEGIGGVGALGVASTVIVGAVGVASLGVGIGFIGAAAYLWTH